MEKLSKKITASDLAMQALFKNTNLKTIMSLLSDSCIYNVKKNEIIIHATEKNNNIYLILSGSFHVLLSENSSNPIATLNTGQSIGEITAIDHQPASTFVKASEDSTVLMVEKEIICSLISKSHTVSNNLLLILSQRLRHSNFVINQIKKRLKEYKYNATIDALTNLYNRHWLNNMFRRIMLRCYKNNKALSVMMIDIDHFKDYNDKNGHLAGDLALRTVSSTIIKHLRPEDLVTRYGGEELLALLPGLNINSAVTIAERLRKAVKKMIITNKNGQQLPNITISIGVADMKNHTDPNLLIETVDQAMYKAKQMGRDKVCSTLSRCEK